MKKLILGSLTLRLGISGPVLPSLAAVVCLALGCQAREEKTEAQAKPANADSALVPLDLKLPSPAFKGTPKDIQLSSYVEPLSDKPRAPFMVPAGLKNLAPA